MSPGFHLKKVHVDVVTLRSPLLVVTAECSHTSVCVCERLIVHRKYFHAIRFKGISIDLYYIYIYMCTCVEYILHAMSGNRLYKKASIHHGNVQERRKANQTVLHKCTTKCQANYVGMIVSILLAQCQSVQHSGRVSGFHSSCFHSPQFYITSTRYMTSAQIPDGTA